MADWTTLIICEKPEVARDVAGALIGPNPEAFRGRPLPFVGKGLCVFACQGHLVRLMEPEEIDPKWADRGNLDLLPIQVKDWPKVPEEGQRGSTYAKIAQAAHKAKKIVHAGDPDEEGQLIVDEVLSLARIDPYGPNVYRALVNNNLPDEIRREFENAKPNANYAGLARSAYARQIADFTFGVNESRLLAIRTGSRRDVVGRVLTPTLGLLVNRHLAITGHTERHFYELRGWVDVEDGDATLSVPYRLHPSKELLAGERRLFERDRAVEAKCVWDRLRLSEVEFKATPKEEAPPMPFSLLSLTKEMGARWDMRPQAVLDATQKLRDEHKAITYNRTDCEYLEDGHFEEAQGTLSIAAKCCGIDLAAWPVDFSRRGKCFDSSKVTAHHAIIPQANKVDVSKLSKAEERVYRAVVERYAAQFMPPRKYEEVSSTIPLEDYGEMRASYERELSPGWRAVFPKRKSGVATVKDDAAKVPAVSPGVHPAKKAEYPPSEIVSRKTSPPKPYTEATLMSDMANVAKYVKDPALKAALVKKDEGKQSENGSIGTPATRADTLRKLKDAGYAENVGKAFQPTARGIALYQAMPGDIKGPEMTARWIVMLGDVESGELDPNSVAESTVEAFRRHRDVAYVGVRLPRDGETVVGACPRCGRSAVLREGKTKDGRAWAKVSCSSNVWTKGPDGKPALASGCGWQANAVVAGKKLSQRTVQTLLSEGKTSELKGFKSKAGKEFSASLVLDKAGNVAFAPFKKNGKKTAASGRRPGPAKGR